MTPSPHLADASPVQRHALECLEAGLNLSQKQASALFTEIVAGEVDDAVLEAVLVRLRDKGETPEEIAGAALAIRGAAMGRFDRPDYVFSDTCGTGGDGFGTVNISTAVAFVVAAAGVPVVKHGNRSVSSKCGSADVLEALGAKLRADPTISRRTLDEAGVCFLFAPQYHLGARHAMRVRKKLGTRTIFNVLGPLVNPARPDIQVMGVYDAALTRPAATTLRLMGCKAALTVYGSGLDEVALHGPTTISLLRESDIEDRELTPASFGVAAAPLHELAGGGPDENAAWMRTLLRGGGTATHNAAVAANAATVLWLAGKETDLASATRLALGVLASGKPAQHLDAFVELTHA
ncbi:MAG: anthranilate phosphoribosyltransferase [Nannocystaceae bacterium]